MVIYTHYMYKKNEWFGEETCLDNVSKLLDISVIQSLKNLNELVLCYE
jgi:hypothetical protein